MGDPTGSAPRPTGSEPGAAMRAPRSVEPPAPVHAVPPLLVPVTLRRRSRLAGWLRPAACPRCRLDPAHPVSPVDAPDRCAVPIRPYRRQPTRPGSRTPSRWSSLRPPTQSETMLPPGAPGAIHPPAGRSKRRPLAGPPGPAEPMELAPPLAAPNCRPSARSSLLTSKSLLVMYTLRAPRLAGQSNGPTVRPRVRGVHVDRRHARSTVRSGRRGRAPECPPILHLPRPCRRHDGSVAC